MSGWKKSPEQVRLMEKEVQDLLYEENKRRDNSPNLDQYLEASYIMEKALIRALEVGGIENSALNVIKVAVFHLALLERSYYYSKDSSRKEINRDTIRAATDYALKSAREFLDGVEEGEDDE